MNKLTISSILALTLISFTSNVYANHCSGGHKEIKETSETNTEESKESKSN